MKYLNSKAHELFSGSKISYRGRIYWASIETMSIYCMTNDADISGRLTGRKVATITADWQIVKAN